MHLRAKWSQGWQSAEVAQYVVVFTWISKFQVVSKDVLGISRSSTTIGMQSVALREYGLRRVNGARSEDFSDSD